MCDAYYLDATPMANSYTLPTVDEVRDRINNMPISSDSEVKYRNALRYIHLIAGRVSEFAGKYAPIGKDAHIVDIDGVKAVLFLVQTAQRDGRIRPVALPIDPFYEPWTEPLYEWFKAHENSNPFGGLTSRSYQRMASIVFDGLKWPVEKYLKTEYKEVDKSRILFERTVDGEREYLVEYDDLERRWVKDPKVAAAVVEKGGHWRDFSLMSLRHLRMFELRILYNFTKDNIETYTGLSGVDPTRLGTRTLNRYQYGSRSGELQIEYQKNIAKSYFKNLLKSRKYERL